MKERYWEGSRNRSAVLDLAGVGDNQHEGVGMRGKGKDSERFQLFDSVNFYLKFYLMACYICVPYACLTKLGYDEDLAD